MRSGTLTWREWGLWPWQQAPLSPGNCSALIPSRGWRQPGIVDPRELIHKWMVKVIRGYVITLEKKLWALTYKCPNMIWVMSTKGVICTKGVKMCSVLIPCSQALKEHDVIKWKHFRHYWPCVRGIHWSPVNSSHKGQWHGALVFSLIYARTRTAAIGMFDVIMDRHRITSRTFVPVVLTRDTRHYIYHTHIYIHVYVCVYGYAVLRNYADTRDIIGSDND